MSQDHSGVAFLFLYAQKKAASKIAKAAKASKASTIPGAGCVNDCIKTKSKGESHCIVCKKEGH